MATIKSITKGIAIEQLVIHDNYSFDVPTHKITNPLSEYDYYLSIIKKISANIQTQITQLPNESEAKDILNTHLTILIDPLINEEVHTLINDNHDNAFYAYQTVINKYISIFKSLDNEIIKSRTNDLEDLFNQFAQHHLGQVTQKKREHNFILYAEKLLASDLLHYNTALIKGVILAKEAITAHIVILVKELNIPFIINTGKLAVKEQLVILDTYDNKIITDINNDILSKYKSKKEVYINSENLLYRFIDKKSMTKDGHSIELLSNISSLQYHIP